MIDLVYLANLDQIFHPIEGMRKLGIEYETARPTGSCDQWEFFNCTNIPDPLPRYLINVTKPKEKDEN